MSYREKILKDLEEWKIIVLFAVAFVTAVVIETVLLPAMLIISLIVDTKLTFFYTSKVWSKIKSFD